MLASDVAHSGLKTLLLPLAEVGEQALNAAMGELADHLTAVLTADGYPKLTHRIDWEADLRHEGQASELTIRFEADGDIVTSLKDGFLAEYRKTYGYRDETPIELVKIRLTARGCASGGSTSAISTSRCGRRRKAPNNVRYRSTAASRPSWFPVIGRTGLSQQPVDGPLVVEEFDTTIVVPGHATVHRDRVGNVVIDLGDAA